MITVTTRSGVRRAVRGVLFDMDGTVVDSLAVTERTWGAWAERNGVSEGFRILHGRPAHHTVRHAFPDADEATIGRLTTQQTETEWADLDGVTPMDGAHDLIAWLESNGIPWAIVTSADLTLAEARLGVAGIDPPTLVTCEQITRGKPDPEPYQLGASLIGIPIADCLVVEDAPAGLESGLASGAVTAALNELPGDIRIADLKHLHELLRHGLTD
jgi:mannitol-1-/sugar-/sorbitol-6-phosphatase